MSQEYQLKYRPLQFKQVVGQKIPKRFLSNLIKMNQQGSNIILQGSYGSGKTTLARIFAKALNCKAPTDEGEPCLSCEHCLSMDRGDFGAYHELDAASNGRVDEVRALKEIAMTRPVGTIKYRVMVFDEVQAMSKQAWDALLKLIEEAPKHLVLLFLTTEFKKVSDTVASRCHKLDISTLTHKELLYQVSKISDLEGITLGVEVANHLSKQSKGHPRDLLKSLYTLNMTYGKDLGNHLMKDLVSNDVILGKTLASKYIVKHLDPHSVSQESLEISDISTFIETFRNTIKEYIMHVSYKVSPTDPYILTIPTDKEDIKDLCQFIINSTNIYTIFDFVIAMEASSPNKNNDATTESSNNEVKKTLGRRFIKRGSPSPKRVEITQPVKKVGDLEVEEDTTSQLQESGRFTYEVEI